MILAADAAQVAQQVSDVLSEYLGVIGLIFLGEIVIGTLLVKAVTSAMGLKGGFGAWVVCVIVVPILHHASHIIPLIGFLVWLVLASLIVGAVYHKRNGEGAAGCFTGFLILIVRMMIHYFVMIVGILVFAGKLYSDLKDVAQ